MKRYVWVITIFALHIVFPPSAFAAGFCEELAVTGGNNRFVPSTVSFHAKAADPAGPVQGYRFYFGDGTQTDIVSPDAVHNFTVSGTFTARVDIKDSEGTWKSGPGCQTIFSLLTSPLESQKSGCGNVFILYSNNVPAGSNVKFLVTGYDNKSGIKEYSIDFGNGQMKQSNVGNFDLTFTAPGTYTIKGYIKDSKNIDKGGNGSCQAPLYITGEPLVSQPATGTPTWFTVAGLVAGICLYFIVRKNYLHR